MWFEILLALMNHLIATPGLKGVAICVGSDAKIPSGKTVVLIRGKFDPKTNDTKSVNSQTVYIECWDYDDSESPQKGYEKLSVLERVVMTALNQFGAGSTLINNKRVQVRLGQTEPDGDAFRPSVGSRTAVTIRWQ